MVCSLLQDKKHGYREACKKNHQMASIVTVQRGIATDKITFRKDQITQIITVLDIPESRVGAKLVDIYNDTPPNRIISRIV
jgi:ribosome-associated heat shock protein Hsp15